MKNFNLITEADKAVIADRQAYYQLLRVEIDPENGLTERGLQLRDFKEKYDADAKLVRVRLKVEAMNLYRDHLQKVAKKLISTDMVGEKVYKVDGSFTAKHKDFFQVEDVNMAGQKVGHRTHSYVNRSYKSIDVTISVSVWENGERGEYKSSFRLYDLEDDFMTIKAVREDVEVPAKINLTAELKKAEKYLKFKHEAEQKLSKLKGTCDYVTLETIENSQLYKFE